MFLAKSNKQKVGLFACSVFSLGLILYCFFYSTGLKGDTDNIWHYNFSHYSWENPLFFLKHWGKPIYTILSSPFAQFGIEGSRAFNTLAGILTAIISFKVLKKLGYEMAFLAILFVIAAPIYISMLPTAMTEPLCSLFLVLSIYAVVSDKFILSALILSFIFLVRSEAFIFMPIFGAYYIYKKQYKAIPFLLLGFAIFSVIGGIVFGDVSWLITKHPYQGENPYRSGEITHFIERSHRIFGITQLVFFILSIVLFLDPRKLKNRFLSLEFFIIFISIIAFFLAHTFVFWKGIGNSMGLVRVMAVISPLVSMLAIFSIQEIYRRIKTHKILAGLFLIGIFISVGYGPFRKKDIPVLASSIDKTVKASTDWYKENGDKKAIVSYLNPWVTVHLGLDPFDKTQAREKIRDINDPGKGVETGRVFFWDSQFGPVEGHLPKQRIIESGNFEILKRFVAKDSTKVWTGDLYEMIIFRRK